MKIPLNCQSISSELMNWYLREDLHLPWRSAKNPYSIWLSEVMLQQTRVSTVLPYYMKWLQTLPDVRSVAEAKLDFILKMWEGLGYYQRARNFHRACRIIIAKHGGEIPHEITQFSKLWDQVR